MKSCLVITMARPRGQHRRPQLDLQKIIILNTQFLVFDTQFLVFDAQFLVLNAKFINLTHQRRFQSRCVLVIERAGKIELKRAKLE